MTSEDLCDHRDIRVSSNAALGNSFTMGADGAEREGGGGSDKASRMSRTSLLRAGGLLRLLRDG